MLFGPFCKSDKPHVVIDVGLLTLSYSHTSLKRPRPCLKAEEYEQEVS